MAKRGSGTLLATGDVPALHARGADVGTRWRVRSEARAVTVVAVPIEVAEQAARDLAHYPLFMVGARAVAPVDGREDTYRWVARSGVRTRRWEVVRSHGPGGRVAWRSIARGTNDGAFTLEGLGDQTRVTLRWARDQDGRSLARATTRSLANFQRALETGQSQRRTPDPLLVATAVATLTLGAGAIIGARWWAAGGRREVR